MAGSGSGPMDTSAISAAAGMTTLLAGAGAFLLDPITGMTLMATGLGGLAHAKARHHERALAGTNAAPLATAAHGAAPPARAVAAEQGAALTESGALSEARAAAAQAMQERDAAAAEARIAKRRLLNAEKRALQAQARADLLQRQVTDSGLAHRAMVAVGTAVVIGACYQLYRLYRRSQGEHVVVGMPIHAHHVGAAQPYHAEEHHDELQDVLQLLHEAQQHEAARRTTLQQDQADARADLEAMAAAARRQLAAGGGPAGQEGQQGLRRGTQVRFVGGGRFQQSQSWADGSRLRLGDVGVIASVGGHGMSDASEWHYLVDFPEAQVRLAAADLRLEGPAAGEESSFVQVQVRQSSVQ
eukprot:TRINITY_DN71161_c0_g1_i1.p1 TRINITY_DN71161_c0_g1~~TRINITY_DN71161_c0_g1_i1.p1  ORF type:complete len:384 (+),score=144.99 TRINITY_DN71161_c0_g1_i1:83-1153(+)